MRRTTICLAIVALLLGTQAWAEDVLPGLPIPQTQPAAPVAVPDAVVPGNASGAQPGPVQSQPSPNGPAPNQQWQPLETIVPMPDVTTSNVNMPNTELSMLGPVIQARPHGPCCEKTGRGYCCPVNWYVDQRVRFLHHPKPRGTMVGEWGGVGQAYNGIELIDVFTLADGMTTRSMSMAPAAGYEITIGHYLGRDSENRDCFVEFTYYGLNNWDQQYGIHQTNRPTVEGIAFTGVESVYPIAANLPPTQTETFGNIYSVFDNRLAGFNRIDDLTERYASRFDNFEVNMRIRPRKRHDRLVLYQSGRWQRESQDGIFRSYLIGIRGISLDESYSLIGSGQVVVDEYATDPITQTVTNTRGEYDIRTHNDMVGVQLGGDWVYRKGFAELGIRMKGGVFINFADQYSTVLSTGGLGDPMGDVELYDVNGPYTDVNNQYSEQRLARSRDVAGVAELGFTAGYQIRSNLVVRAAYDLMWISGVALAPEQINGRIGAPGRINRNGMMFMQSLSLGLELDW